ncbi:unnamed protein product, partial [Rotaria sordida]
MYNDRAELTRLLRYHFDNEGTYDLVLQGLSPCADLTSFHVSGGTGKTCPILEVYYQTRYEDPSVSLSDTTPLDQLQTQLDVVQGDIYEHTQEFDRLKKQRTWLDGRASKLMNQEGPLSTRDLETMEQFLNFYHKMLTSNKTDVTLEVSYLISSCSWSASYDIRVDSGEGRQPKTQLTYYGII